CAYAAHLHLPSFPTRRSSDLVSTRSDPHARDVIFDLLPAKFPRLFNAGRLDAQSEGLLLLTNDGDLAQRLTHPRYEIDKEYEVIDRKSTRLNSSHVAISYAVF